MNVSEDDREWDSLASSKGISNKLVMYQTTSQTLIPSRDTGNASDAKSISQCYFLRILTCVVCFTPSCVSIVCSK